MTTGASGVRITLDHPRRHLGRRLWRSLATVAGAVLVGLGLAASIPSVPLSIAVLGLVAGWVTSEPLEELPAGQILLAWAILTPVAIVGLRSGLRLLRRYRTLVLFLRRFGHDEAQHAVSFAVLRTIGPSWRIVTLDDEEMVPIGIPQGTRRLFRVGELGATCLGRLAFLIGARTFPVVIWASIGVLAVAVAGPAWEHYTTGVTSVDRWQTVLDPYVTIFVSVLEGHPPIEAIGPTLPGIFALLVTLGLFSFLALVATMIVLLLALPFSTVLLFLTSSAEAARDAESGKSATVTSAAQVRQAAGRIVERSRRVFGPRLAVLRVATPEWQLAVRELASQSSVVLVDVSEPTEHVIWEVEELTIRKRRCVVIGEYARVMPLAATAPSPAERTPLQSRLAALLHSREVLAYTTDRAGLARFARALRGALLEHS
jgi:hypothetical protein